MDGDIHHGFMGEEETGRYRIVAVEGTHKLQWFLLYRDEFLDYVLGDFRIYLSFLTTFLVISRSTSSCSTCVFCRIAKIDTIAGIGNWNRI